MTNKEIAIRKFAKAMRNANTQHMQLFGTFTLNMHDAWELYIEACKQEAEDVRK